MKTLIVLLCAICAPLAAQQSSPARYKSGGLPALPALAVGGGQAIVELSVTAGGTVDHVTVLRRTPPFTDALASIVGNWHFAADAPAKVVVAAVFRAPATVGPTHGQAPRDVAAASPEASFPTALREPAFPPRARNGGVVLVEVRVDATGAVSAAAIMSSAPPFDQPALEAAKQTRFRAARVGGRAAVSYAYLIFGFPAPVSAHD